MPPLRPPRRRPDASASILLLGGRRTGKSTLGVIASVLLKRPLVEFDFFKEKQSKLVSDSDVLERLLSTYRLGHVLVCPVSLVLDTSAWASLCRFALSHPVVHITGNGEATDVNWFEAAQTCSNYAYHNSPEMPGSRPSVVQSSSPFLTLKQVEEQFVIFLSNIFGHPTRHHSLDTFEHPLTLRSPFTYMLSHSLAEFTAVGCLGAMLQDGTDAVELRIDCDERRIWHDPLWSATTWIGQCFTSIRRAFEGPLIYHVESPKRPVPDGLQERYHDLVWHGLRLLADYVSVDLSCDDGIITAFVESRSHSKILGHRHFAAGSDSGWNDESRSRILANGFMRGCDVVRLTQPAISPDDNHAVRDFFKSAMKHVQPCTRGPQAQMIAYNTGDAGRMSHVFNEVFTPVTHPTVLKLECCTELSRSRTTMPRLQQGLYSCFAQDAVDLHVIGVDVVPSLSPAAYQAALKHLSIPHSFTPVNMTSVDEIHQLTANPRFGGCIITQGLKEDVLQHTSHVSKHAQIIRAVNTLIPIRCDWGPAATEPPLQLWRDRNHAGPVKGLYGDNTDWIGLYRCAARNLSPINSIDHKTTGLVLGAGGTARAAIYAMIKLGVRQIVIYNRTLARANTLSKYYNDLVHCHSSGPGNRKRRRGDSSPVSYPSPTIPTSVYVEVMEKLSDAWPAHLSQPTIIINCIRAPLTSPEAKPKVLIPKNWLHSPYGGVVIDTCYEPLQSVLITQIQGLSNRGWVAVDGIQLLVEQARAQFELVTGRRAPWKRMSMEISRSYQARNPLADLTINQARMQELKTELEALDGPEECVDSETYVTPAPSDDDY